MLIGRYTSLALLSALALTSVACSQGTSSDAEESSAAATTVDASSLITVSANLPFEVKRMHPATGRIQHARWGQHGGPVATLADEAGTAPIVTRWWIPSSINAPAAAQPLAAALPSGLPSNSDSFYWNNDGFVDLTNGALLAWSNSGGNFTGELLQYSVDYENVVSRAFVNGYYSGAGVGSTRIVYSGLSGLSAVAEPDVKEPGLWVHDLGSGGTLLNPSGSKRLVEWTGASGPVTTDNNGNVFVAPFLEGGDHTDAIYALAKNQTLSNDPQTPSTLNQSNEGGTASIAAVSAPGSTKGWVFAKGWDGDQALPIYARPYASTADAVTNDGDIVADAIKPVLSSSTLSVFGDPSGNLWVTVTADAGAWLIQLEPKPQP